jgi:hypothetical protein
MQAQQERMRRGVELYNHRRSEFVRVRRDVFEVPGSAPGAHYRVDLTGDDARCPCPDSTRHPELTCKHGIASEIYAARLHRNAAGLAQAITEESE